MRFLETEAERDYSRAKYVVLPCPHEATTSYGKGTKNGPMAILRASRQLETFDEEKQTETYLTSPIFTANPVAASDLPKKIVSLLMDGKVPVVLGGEHSLTPFAVSAFIERYRDLSVLSLDAHADLRDSYRGSKHSHACAIRRVLEIAPVVQAGVRSISKEEWDFARESGQLNKIHWAGKIPEKMISQLSNDVYVTIDVDVFDPGVIRATGTPEPGGLAWREMIDILTQLSKKKNIVGFDVVELSPIKDDPASDFTAAKLVYKLIGLIS
ncbi:agmatinase [candidate division WOR-1 bacterium RIFOXYA12_FULL_52_29]|uniref:Agmatinase n=1 Tax=candidate division WOR-1 bacterium RIFOXYC12_FULL_54_18 TaxID=1802584 RepID=A0A1F4T721_UNCSA|nr:MAG: agmatinase [candidate division WOR-1 bacterium RIFOXYA2_FULL_51_19]OGC18125.1 MAG: agmatinase [candidate division WOR-1 bacterium RIFOXYA12_FULL_52_29]OGC26980.1 MAG: agmatinase [candidate division WOR-1 bacterium RIFOXYB2_FULL_45_9]OGC28542.1 MAG: agmatinase [candidate division WOR-1 bacterium RIFOXYC12_FULL_54_18]OGC31003.1 MAG: agmatinase [candidate division WOR-1 bacterium RIFOXYB12_FULL_52_16]